MAKPAFTEQQNRAIYTHGKDILVSAAAGSGKTAVLVERIIQMITDKERPVDIDRLLVVTFTRAAANEMKKRISDTLNELLLQEPDNKHLRKQLVLINKSSITTIDSFCLEVVRRNFAALDLDPGFKISNEAEIKQLQREVLKEVFEANYEREDNEGFLALVETFCRGVKDHELANLVLEIYNFSNSMPFPDEWLDYCVSCFYLEENQTIFDTVQGKIIINQFSEKLNLLYTLAEETLRILKIDIENLPVSFDGYEAAVISDFKLMSSIKKSFFDDFEKFLSNVHNLEFEKLGRKTILNDEEKNLVKARRDMLKKQFKSIMEFFRFFSDLNDITEQANYLYYIIKNLVDLVKEFKQSLFKAQNEKQLYYFNDVSHFCIKALLDENKEATPAAIQLREQYEEIIIDEYQDSNYIQELILSTISRKNSDSPNRFMVGDIKQCIYKFRLANPDIFTKKYNSFAKRINSSQNNYLINLSKNFRSKKCVLDSINFIFYQIMDTNLGEIDYDDTCALNNGFNYPINNNSSQNCEFVLIDTTENEEFADEAFREMKAIEYEATYVAKRINELLSSDFVVFDTKKNDYRPVRLSDIVILLRSPKNSAIVFTEALAKSGIPAIESTSSPFFEFWEVSTIISYLRIIDNPKLDIDLITILYSPIYSFTVDELSMVRAFCKKGDYYDAIKKYCESDEISDELKEKFRLFLDELENFRSFSLFHTKCELLSYIYEKTNFYNYVGILLNGNLKQGNLDILSDFATEFDNSESFGNGLYGFIKYIDCVQENPHISEAKAANENLDAVQILSMHKSKGLEYPVVFLPNMSKKFNFTSLYGNFIMHQGLGFGPKLIDYKNRVISDTLWNYAIKEQIKLEFLSEEMRILYVAMTRAREKLIIVASGKESSLMKKHHSSESLVDKALSFEARKDAQHYLDWLYPCFLRLNSPWVHFKCNSWKLTTISKDSIIIDNSIIAQQKSVNYENLLMLRKTYENEEHCNSEVLNRLNFSYPNSDRLPTKISISEIKKMKMPLEDSVEMFSEAPDFSYPTFGTTSEKTLSAADKGTAMHTLLESIDFKADYDIPKLKELGSTLIQKSVLTEEAFNSINLFKVLTFLSSPIGQRIRASEAIYKETPFVMGLSPFEIYGEEYKSINSTILVHGIIDIYFEEGDDIILLDYKTDYVPDGNADIILNRYRVQIELYKKAIERSTGKSVRESYLYLFGIEKECKY